MLQQFHHYHGGDFRVECSTASGRYLTLREITSELARRLSGIFLPDGPWIAPRDLYLQVRLPTYAGLRAANRRRQ